MVECLPLLFFNMYCICGSQVGVTNPLNVWLNWKLTEIVVRRGDRYCLLTAHTNVSFLLFCKEKVHIYDIDRGVLQ